jgi:hypothetical protein
MIFGGSLDDLEDPKTGFGETDVKGKWMTCASI